MEVILWVLLTVATVFADESQERRSKLPYVADALGNTLPPPSNLPATVGSPVNLLTPDRYEFYTFDESGELVKRLMTLEEIQAIVAAGEETEGLVTFANDNQPTIAFNFSQPPYTKVHSVVTNVQNVLKAQMEAHKNKPHTQPTLDTPDVSDSWSLILPSIFGNTGVDITPDKTMGSYVTPETDTIDDNQPEEDENTLSKEAQILVETVVRDENKFDMSSTTTSTITTSRPTTTSKRIIKPPSSTIKMTTTKTTIQPKTTTSTTTTRPITKPNLLSSSNVTHKGYSTYTSTTISSTSKPSSTSKKPVSTTTKPITSTKVSENFEVTNDRIHSFTHLAPTTERGDIQYEMVSTYIPVSTVTYLSEKVTYKPKETTKIIQTLENSDRNSTTSYINSPTAWMIHSQSDMTTNKIKETTDNDVYSSHDKINSTTITTQSVSPSTTATSTELVSLESSLHQNSSKDNDIGSNSNIANNIKENDPTLPLFDVAQSLSQIASDLGGTYRPMETSNNFLESTKITNIDLESKENLEIEIPPETENNNDIKIGTSNKTDNFIKISVIEPHGNNESTISNIEENKIIVPNNTQLVTNEVTTLDPILSESMGDLLSQVVNEKPDSDQNIEELLEQEMETTTVEFTTEATTEYNTANTEATTEVLFIEKNIHTSNDINSGLDLMKMENKHKENDFVIENNSNSTIINNSTKPLLDISGEINDKNEEIVKTNGTISSDKQYTPLNSSTEINKDIEVENEKSEESTPVTTKKIDDQQVLKLKNDNNTVNSTLPSYKSDINKDSEKSDYFKNQTNSIEKKDYYNKNKDEDQELLPKVEEFKKKIQKVNIDDKELGTDRNNSWKLIPTVSPPKTHESTKFTKNKLKPDIYNHHENIDDKNIVLEVSNENQGLELTTKDLGDDIAEFTKLCNELAFRYWNDMIETIDKKRSFVFSPYSITSMLAMMFMGAKGATSGEMNDILKLDDMVTFNPHFTLKNISDSIETTPAAGVVVSAFIRELYSDRNKGKILTFYKERAQHFYNGHVEEVNFKLISDIIRRRTNLLVKRYTWGKIMEYMKTNSIVMQPPLAAFSANIFQTDCSETSVDGRDGEMYFVVSPNVRQRRLVPVPAVVYKHNFLAGYDPVLDATAAALGNVNSVVSTLFVMPGQQGNIVHAEDLEDLEKRLLNSNPSNPAWNRLLRTLLPRVGLELQIPRFSHKSVFNISSTLKRMGLKDLFDADHADLGGLNGPSKDLYLSDMIQQSTFTTCGEGVIGDQHHIEEYPEIFEVHKRRSARWITGWDEPRDYQRAFHDPHDVGEAMHLPLHLRPRQARLPARNAQPARLKFDRPFLFFVRHNPSGMILYVGKYNPRLLP
ncbi:unnamed protein product [Parnassius apollo]|uniref:(apollo) hypothetical protein n=1 Tax=Parnassius apollo TaxID=110799 RepID=A0A8S3WTF2_PARAO|nr:unnamed protein product [Parnassius apollo]